MEGRGIVWVGVAGAVVLGCARGGVGEGGLVDIGEGSIRFDAVGDEGRGEVVGVDAGVSDEIVVSWLGGNVTVAFGLQPRSSANIKINATRILRFIPTQTWSGIRMDTGNQATLFYAEEPTVASRR